MTYSIIGILASIILLIINRDILWSRDGQPRAKTQRIYRYFLLGVLCYYITDMLWGVLYARQLIAILFVDTSIHFAAMVGAVMLWTQYVVSYLDTGSAFERMLQFAGRAFFALEILFITINIFRPVLFWFDENSVYQAGVARYITLGIQILMFLVTSVYTLSVASQARGRARLRHLTIGFFGVSMMLLITIQVFYPLLPLYAMGYMLGTCLLHSFVVEDEKEEYRRELEEAALRDQEQKRELSESREALQEALSVAENANKAKSVFLSNMSHEIRTPLNAIIGLNDIAMNDPTASDQVKGYMSRIGDSARHLLGIINDILDMSRIESGRMTIRHEDFSLTQALEQVNSIIGGQCHDKGIDYDCQVTGQVSDHYIGDVMKLKQVMLNILGNAVKFTPEGGSVRCRIEEMSRFDRKAVLKIIVSDTGIGMSPEFIPHIFDAFSQEDGSSTSRYGSTGLGMPITKSIVELMNGHIDVVSEKGKGSIFTVTVTLEESSAVPCLGGEPSHDTNDMNESEIGGSFVPEQLEENKTADLKGRRVLLAEDVAVNAEIMMMVLGMRDMEVELAVNGREAVKMFESHEPGYYDAILMDMRMPEMDGLEATRIIRNFPREDARSIPVIALTANAFDDDVQRSMQAGLNAHLSKPVEPDALFRKLEDLINH